MWPTATATWRSIFASARRSEPAAAVAAPALIRIIDRLPGLAANKTVDLACGARDSVVTMLGEKYGEICLMGVDAGHRSKNPSVNQFRAAGSRSVENSQLLAHVLGHLDAVTFELLPGQRRDRTGYP